MKRHLAASLLVLILGAALGNAARAEYKVVAAGDSLTFGVGDPEGKGYPFRLERILENERSETVEVVNQGVKGDDSFLLLARLGEILAEGGDIVTLMIGTNDVDRIFTGEIPPEAVASNIEELGRKVNKAGFEVVHVPPVPRPSYAFQDRRNLLTRRVVWDVRELAAKRKRRLVDAYQAFDPAQLLHPESSYYSPQFDPVTGERDFVGHLNPAGYDRLARAFADVLLEIDSVPPVIGSFTPGPAEAVGVEVPEDQVFRIPLFEFAGSSGFDVDSLQLLINGVAVGRVEGRAPSGRVELVHEGLEGLGCLAELGVRAQDRAEPPNTLEFSLERYAIRGREINAGDVDYNCVVEEADIDLFAESFGTVKGEAGFSDLVDFVEDDRIDGLDFSVLAKNFGKSSL